MTEGEVCTVKYRPIFNGTDRTSVTSGNYLEINCLLYGSQSFSELVSHFVCVEYKKVEHDKTLFFTHKVFKHISNTLILLISILQAVKSAIKNTGIKPGPNTKIYGPRYIYMNA